ncbi:MAG: hypothetical protein OJF49_003154 [Ktedonobacterales bacterium]|jgi:hypothetical protein|nr:MAG: hypothetical protein OJF49_003154 [Ktedonobacterales bacterium]
MPTHDEAPRFWRDWDKLTPEQRSLFLAAVADMVADMKAKRPFHPALRVKGFRRLPGVFEMTWANDGRALFTYGTSPHAGDVHITWLRIGTHDILQHP